MIEKKIDFFNKNTNMSDNLGISLTEKLISKIPSFLIKVTIFCLLIMGGKAIYNFLIESQEISKPQVTINETERILGDDYKVLLTEMKKYNIYTLSFVKMKGRYNIDVVFNDGVKLSKVLSFDDDMKKKGIDNIYSFSLEVKKDHKNTIMTATYLNDMIKSLILSKEQINQQIVPEVKYLMKNVGYEYVWNKVPEYNLALFSKETEEKHLKNMPIWTKDIGQEMIGDLLYDMNKSNSKYNEDFKKTLVLAQMFAKQNIFAKEEDVCLVVKKYTKELKNKDNISFIEMVANKSLSNIKNNCKQVS